MPNLNPQVIRKASGTIADPELESEPTVISTNASYTGPRVVLSPTRIDLFEGKYVLLLKDDEFVIFLSSEDIDAFPYSVLNDYISYCSRVRYNITSVPFRIEFPDNLVPADQITFALVKLVLVEREETIFGRVHKLQHYESEPFSIHIMKSDIEQYLKRATHELHVATRYFLIGCENLQYFLIEFYKTLETLKESFGSEAKFLKELGPHGLKKSDYKTVTRYANDQQNPLNIARHAPLPGSSPQSIDTRHLLTDPLSKKVFADSVRITRLAIDAYRDYLWCQAGAKTS